MWHKVGSRLPAIRMNWQDFSGLTNEIPDWADQSDKNLLCYTEERILFGRFITWNPPNIFNKEEILHVGAKIWILLSRAKNFQPPSNANLEVLKKKPGKTWRLGPQTWTLQKYASNKNNNERLFQCSEYSLLVVARRIPGTPRHPRLETSIAAISHLKTRVLALNLSSKINTDIVFLIVQNWVKAFAQFAVILVGPSRRVIIEKLLKEREVIFSDDVLAVAGLVLA